MTKTYNFVRSSKTKEGVPKPGKMYPIKTDNDEITLRQLNVLRTVCFGITPIDWDEPKLTDGKDVSGVTSDSPYQIIWKDGKLIAVPYSDDNIRVAERNSPTYTLIVRDWMAKNQKRQGKPEKGKPAVMIPDPIVSYDSRVYIAITGRMKSHSTRNTDKPLTLDLTGVNGLTQDHVDDLAMAAEMIGCPVDWVI